MIPKIIHYCWFGNKEDISGGGVYEITQKCKASWQKFAPDYEIKLWNEENFDINAYPYAKEAYEEKKYAFVADVARLHAITTEGGIYLDTDQELLKPIDELLSANALVGFEDEKYIGTAFLACEKGHPFFVEFLESYKTLKFKNPNGTLNQKPNVEMITERLKPLGLKKDEGEIQNVANISVYPRIYFYPPPISNPTSYAIHHWAGSWLSEKDKEMNKIHRFLVDSGFSKTLDSWLDKTHSEAYWKDLLYLSKKYFMQTRKDELFYYTFLLHIYRATKSLRKNYAKNRNLLNLRIEIMELLNEMPRKTFKMKKRFYKMKYYLFLDKF